MRWRDGEDGREGYDIRHFSSDIDTRSGKDKVGEME